MTIIYDIFYRIGFLQTQYFWTWLYFNYSIECSPTFATVDKKRSTFWQIVLKKKENQDDVQCPMLIGMSITPIIFSTHAVCQTQHDLFLFFNLFS